MMDKTVSKNKRYHLLKNSICIYNNKQQFFFEGTCFNKKKVFRLTLDAWKRILHSLCSALP